MKTTIRILIDEDFNDAFAEKILATPSISGVYVRTTPSLKGKDDDDIWDHAQTEERILVAQDHRFNKRKHPVCSHEGIIRFKTQSKHDSARLEAFRKFMLCGHRTRSKHAITYLYDDRCVFATCDDGAIEVKYT